MYNRDGNPRTKMFSTDDDCCRVQPVVLAAPVVGTANRQTVSLNATDGATVQFAVRISNDAGMSSVTTLNCLVDSTPPSRGGVFPGSGIPTAWPDATGAVSTFAHVLERPLLLCWHGFNDPDSAVLSSPFTPQSACELACTHAHDLECCNVRRLRRMHACMHAISDFERVATVVVVHVCWRGACCERVSKCP